MPSRPAGIKITPNPVCRLIEEAREAQGLSQRQAGPLIGVTGNRWGHIVRGWRGSYRDPVAVNAKPATLARMAKVVGLHPDFVEEVDPEVAAEMRKLPSRPTIIRSSAQERRVLAKPKLTLQQLTARLAALQKNSEPAVWNRALRVMGLAPVEDKGRKPL